MRVKTLDPQEESAFRTAAAPSASLEDFDFARVRLVRKKGRQRRLLAWVRPELPLRAAVPVVVALSAGLLLSRLLGFDYATLLMALLLGLYVPVLLLAAVLSQWKEELDSDLARLREEHAALTGQEI